MASQHHRHNSLYRRFPRLLLLPAGEGGKLLPSANGEPNVVLIRGGRSHYLHHPEQPSREAELFVAGFKEVVPQAHVIFLE